MEFDIGFDIGFDSVSRKQEGPLPQILVNRPIADDPLQAASQNVARGRAASRRHAVYNLAENVLVWLHSRGLVSDRQMLAGEQLQRDYMRAGLSPKVTMQWDAPAPDGSPRSARSHDGDSVAQIDAKRRFDGAMAHVGAGLDAICWRVVCAGEGMADAERALGWPGRSGRVVLTLALDRLADHYRVPGG